MTNNKKLLFSTRNSHSLSQEIAECYGVTLNKIEFIDFSDGEYSLSFKEQIYEKEIFIIGSTCQPIDNLMEILLMCDAAKRSLAKKINVIIPYFGWARQDRIDEINSPISAKLIADLITCSGANNIITIDLHADQIQGFFNIPLNHIYSYNIFINYINELKINNLTFASPDTGGMKRARYYASKFQTDIVICYKERKKANEIEFMNIIGNVKNKHVIIIDDIVDTGRTLIKAANLIKKNGAKSVRAIVTHAILSGNADKEINNSELKELITTNTIPINKNILLSSKIKILTCAPLINNMILNINNTPK